MATYTTAVDESEYSTEGFVRVQWTHDEADPEYYQWRVYRSVEDDIDVDVWGDWELVSSTIETGPWFEYHDYTAPSNRRVRYSVVQATQNAQSVVTEDAKDNIRIVTPSDTKYWLIHPTTDAYTMALPLATSDSFSEDREEGTMVLLGRGRKKDRGEILGLVGSLTIDFRSRADYKRLMRLWDDGSWLFLRNPFGDVTRVSIGKPDVTRTPGVGTREYNVVALPYEEVLDA